MLLLASEHAENEVRFGRGCLQARAHLQSHVQGLRLPVDQLNLVWRGQSR